MRVYINTEDMSSIFCVNCNHLSIEEESNGLYTETYGVCKKDEMIIPGSVITCDAHTRTNGK